MLTSFGYRFWGVCVLFLSSLVLGILSVLMGFVGFRVDLVFELLIFLWLLFCRVVWIVGDRLWVVWVYAFAEGLV